VTTRILRADLQVLPEKKNPFSEAQVVSFPALFNGKFLSVCFGVYFDTVYCLLIDWIQLCIAIKF
jgi:hypothetical protein